MLVRCNFFFSRGAPGSSSLVAFGVFVLKTRMGWRLRRIGQKAASLLGLAGRIRAGITFASISHSMLSFAHVQRKVYHCDVRRGTASVQRQYGCNRVHSVSVWIQVSSLWVLDLILNRALPFGAFLISSETFAASSPCASSCASSCQQCKAVLWCCSLLRSSWGLRSRCRRRCRRRRLRPPRR